MLDVWVEKQDNLIPPSVLCWINDFHAAALLTVKTIPNIWTLWSLKSKHSFKDWHLVHKRHRSNEFANNLSFLLQFYGMSLKFRVLPWVLMGFIYFFSFSLQFCYLLRIKRTCPSFTSITTTFDLLISMNLAQPLVFPRVFEVFLVEFWVFYFEFFSNCPN